MSSKSSSKSLPNRLIPLLCIATLSGLASPQARALETDQFTLPPQPLEDIGTEVSAEVLKTIQVQVDQTNAAIAQRLKDPAPGGRGQNQNQSQDQGQDQDKPSLQKLQSAAYMAEQVYEEVGTGLPETTIERLAHYRDFDGKKNVRFKPNVFDSVYAWVYSPTIFAFLFNSPTIRMYGFDFGTDKVGHFFQQGYEYFERHEHGLSRGETETQALDDAVQYGAMTESTFYGVVIDGVYSNADLAANYAGFKFYRNIGSEVKIGEQVLAPILLLQDGHWMINPERANAELLKPYLSDHLNEAYNPCKYTFNLELLRDHVRDRCDSWTKNVPGFGEEFIRAKMEASKTWFGEPYGWYLPEDKAATLLECFNKPEEQSPAPSPTPSPSESTDCDLVQVISGKCQALKFSK